MFSMNKAQATISGRMKTLRDMSGKRAWCGDRRDG